MPHTASHAAQLEIRAAATPPASRAEQPAAARNRTEPNRNRPHTAKDGFGEIERAETSQHFIGISQRERARQCDASHHEVDCLSVPHNCGPENELLTIGVSRARQACGDNLLSEQQLDI